MPSTPVKARKAGTAKRTRAKRVKRPSHQPPKPPLIRTSERTTYEACKWQWEMTYNQHLKPAVEAPALRFGTLVHAALEARYPPGIKRGPRPAPVFEKLFDEELKEVERSWGFRDSDGNWANAKQLGVSMLEHYVEVYGKDEEWKVLASEMTFKVPVYSPEHPDGAGGYQGIDGKRYPKRHILFYYVGTMDGVWQNRMDDAVRVNDYKTCKGDPTKEAAAKGVLDEQGTAYWTWGVDWLEQEGILKPRQLQALDGMLYTFLRKGAKDTRDTNAQGQALNKDGSVSMKQPQPYFHRDLVYRDEEQQQRARQRAIHQAMEMWQRRNGILPIYKSPGTSYPNQQCKGCPVFDVCELEEIGADWEAMRDASLAPWDPYAAHEIKEEGKY